MTYSKLCARVLGILKWPSAVMSMLLLMPAVSVLPMLIDRIIVNTEFSVAIIACLFVFVIWVTVFQDLNNSFLNTFEHELTHMVFGLLTGNLPTDLDVGQGQGGFSFKGHSNWLMIIAPYFFPMFPVIVISAGLLYHLTSTPVPIAFWGVFGTTVGMYFASTIGEIRTNQTDLKRVGFLFSFCFLPGIHVLFIGLLIGFSAFGYDGFGVYFNLLFEQFSNFYKIFE